MWEVEAAACPRLDALPAHDLEGGLRVATADSRQARTKGLGALEDMPADQALHIPRCPMVHTFTMRFPLDLIWLRKDGTVARVDRDVPRGRMKTCLRARSVVECRAGTADRYLAAGVGELGLG